MFYLEWRESMFNFPVLSQSISSLHNFSTELTVEPWVVLKMDCFYMSGHVRFASGRLSTLSTSPQPVLRPLHHTLNLSVQQIKNV